MKRINFNYPKMFLGRNGEFESIAVELSGRTGFDLTLTPITSKNKAARCRIEIPVTSIVEFVNALKEAYADEFADQERLDRIVNYLCDGFDEKTDQDVFTPEQIERILNFEGDINTPLEDIPGIRVWEPLEGHYTVSKFISEVIR